MQSSITFQNPNRGTQFMLEGLTGLEQPSSLPEPEERVTPVTLENFCRQCVPASNRTSPSQVSADEVLS